MKQAKEWNDYYKQQAHANLSALEAMCAEGVLHTNHSEETNLCPRCYAAEYIEMIYQLGLEGVGFCTKLASMNEGELGETRRIQLEKLNKAHLAESDF